MNSQQRLLDQVYDELRAIAAKRMVAEDPGHTLQATALVHEAYCRIVGDRRVAQADRREFFVAASEAMRRVLIDHARRRDSLKRGEGRKAELTLSAIDLADDSAPDSVARLDEAFSRLQTEEPRAFEVVRLRYFAGLDVPDTAEVLGVSARTVEREWAFARVRLFQMLEEQDAVD